MGNSNNLPSEFPNKNAGVRTLLQSAKFKINKSGKGYFVLVTKSGENYYPTLQMLLQNNLDFIVKALENCCREEIQGLTMCFGPINMDEDEIISVMSEIYNRGKHDMSEEVCMIEI